MLWSLTLRQNDLANRISNRLSKYESAVLLPAIQCLAFWAVWRWYAMRLMSSREERFGVVALIVAALFVWRGNCIKRDDEARLSKLKSRDASCLIVETSRFEKDDRALWTATGLVLIYAFSVVSGAPPLLRACVAMMSLGVSLGLMISRVRFGQVWHIGLTGMLLLALPVVSSFQFYAGYPLRLMVAMVAAPMLRLSGFAVVRDGAVLNWAGKLIVIDAPCSGVKMLWAGLFLACVLACVYELKNSRTVALLIAATVCVIAGNVWRAMALFYTEGKVFDVPLWMQSAMHETAGVVAFAVAGAGIVVVAGRLKDTRRLKFECVLTSGWRRIRQSLLKQGFSNVEMRKVTHIKRQAKSLRGKVFMRTAFCAACIVAAGAPLVGTQIESEARSAGERIEFAGWMMQFENRDLTMLPLTEREKSFYAEFPGRTARMTDGSREIIARWVTTPTRKLHPATDCFQAIGYTVEPLPLTTEASGARWSCFTATKGNTKLKVRERITDEAGNAWTDVSAWYWSAVSGTTRAPWRALTLAERADSGL